METGAALPRESREPRVWGHPRASPSSSVQWPESRCRVHGQPCRLQTACPLKAGPRPGRFAVQRQWPHPSSERRLF